MSVMCVLSVRQPWAFLLVSGIKDVENRTWRTDYTGPLLIHAGKTWDHEGYATIQKLFPDAAEAIEKHFRTLFGHGSRSQPVSDHLDEFVAIVGQVELDECMPPLQMHLSRWAELDLWHWCVSNAQKFDKPIPAKGKLGLWRFNTENNEK